MADDVKALIEQIEALKAQNAVLKDALSKSSAEKVMLVTGGSGLVGRAVQAMSTIDTQAGERWIFVGSKDGDLRYVQYLV